MEFGDHLRQCTQSMTLLINEQCKVMETNGEEVVRFGFGQSPFPPISDAVEALKHHAGRKEYAPVQGLPALCAAAANFHNKHDGLSIDPSRVFIGPGSKQMILNLLMCFKRLNVYIPAPAWVSYEPQACIAGQGIVRVRASAPSWRITAEDLKRALQGPAPHADAPRLLILNNPGNPDGGVSERSELEAIAAVCREFNVFVLADEIYGLLRHDDGQHTSFAQVCPERTVLLTGLSKWCGAGGWRIGVFVFAAGMESLMKVFSGIASESYSCVATPVQLAAVAAYESPRVVDYLDAQRRVLRVFGRWAARTLREAGALVTDPKGAFYLFVDFDPLTPPAVRERLQVDSAGAFFLHILKEKGVALLTGEAFGMAPSHFCARLAYVTFDGAAALEASRDAPGVGADAAEDERFVQCHAPRVHRGVLALADFARSLRSA